MELYNRYEKQHYNDENLKKQAEKEIKDPKRKYLSKKLVTTNCGIVISRWASNNEDLQKV